MTEDISNEAEVLSGLSEEGSVYDSEEDRKALKEAKRKRKALVALGAARTTAKKKTATKWTVCPESVANVGGPDSMLGKSMSRYVTYSFIFVHDYYNLTLFHFLSLDAEGLQEVCAQVAKPMKKAVCMTVKKTERL